MKHYSALLVCLLALCPAAADAQPAAGATRALTIVSANPTGEVSALAEANEIRIVFSEPMVTLGRIPAVIRPPYVRITPAIAGSFRWSGTTILIFTPDAKQPLPFATRYEVTVDPTAAAVSGRTLAAPYSFSFTTPTVKLLSTDAHRRGGRADAPYVVLLRFNQPVEPADVLQALAARFAPHGWDEPSLPAASIKRLAAIDPTSVDRFNAKIAAARAAASSSAAVTLRLTNDWDKKRFPPARTLVVFETTTRVPSESQVKLTLAPTLRSPAGAATPGREQEYTISAEHAFFALGFDCAASCNPDRRNPLLLRGDLKVAAFSKALRVRDVTAGAGKDVPRAAEPPKRPEWFGDQSSALTIEDGGFAAQPPASRYLVSLDAGLTAEDGQTLGYTWIGEVENWHRTAFTSFGDGHGVWESSGGPILPFYARNLTTVTQWAAPIASAELMPLIRRLTPNFSTPPDGDGVERKLGVSTDRIQSHGLDVGKALAANGTGVVWTAVRNGGAIPNARLSDQPLRASIVQVTNLGINVKDSPQNTLVFVTRLDNAKPVAGATVTIVNADNSIHWSGTTGADGVATGPGMPVIRNRDYEDDGEWNRPDFLVLAEKDGDLAYVGNNWNEGIQPWDFGTNFNRDEAEPMLRGSVFSDRGVYRLGEEVQFKAILRENTPRGIRLLRAGTPVFIQIRDSQYRLVDERTVTTTAWSSAEWKVTLPGDGALGNYSVRAVLEADKPKPKTAEEVRPGEEPGPELDDRVPFEKAVTGGFLVAAYRRPDFRVDVSLKGDRALAGEPVRGVVSARYLFGATMGARPVKWRFTRSPLWSAPSAVHDKFPQDRWEFVGWSDRAKYSAGDVSGDEDKLAKTGDLALTLTPDAAAGIPYMYTLEGDVEDVSRQHIANRASVLVHPASWYIGVKRPSYFVEQKSGLQTEIVTVAPDGQVAPGVTVDVTLTQIQWTSVRRSEGNGFYTWDTERKEIAAGSWTVTTTAEPVPLSVALPNGGYFVLEATARDGGSRFTTTRTSFYALGDGYTAWARFDHNRIELVPEKRTYKPGDTARIMIQSPWEQATALVTTEREGIRSHRQFALTSTQQSIEIPIADEDIPNVFVSVLLVKGRSQPAAAAKTADDPKAVRTGYDAAAPDVLSDPSDPGKPSFRLGYVELKVEDASKRLKVAVRADKEEYRPANTASVMLDVKDANGRGAPSEVTLWAVDYGVLSLTSYNTPDVLGSVYVQKALQVKNADNRQRIISRRVLTPKGDTDGGGGGADAGAGTMRKDFRVLAFWLGSVETDEYGKGTVEVKLPESLTTYRIMAVAADRGSRFGSSDAEVRINKPLTLKPTFPRFLALGDTAHFGAVVTSQLRTAGAAVVTIKSLDPAILEFTGGAEQTVQMAAGGSIEARFDAAGKRIGRARVQMTVKMANETDAFEDVIPVELLVSPETVAAYGEATDANPTATEMLEVPASVVPGVGGLHVDLSSTAMVGLGEGARYLVEYPYGCAEQRGSRTLALVLAADLGDAFSLPGMNTAKMRPAAQQNLKELEKFQCGDGGFSYWPGSCHYTSPYLTAYLLHVFKTAVDHKYQVDGGMRDRAYAYLERHLAGPTPTNEGWWPSYTAWQAFAVKVLVEGGRNQDSHLTRLYGYRDRMPIFGLAYLHDAYVARGSASADAAARIADLRRRLANAILPEAGSAHVEELNDPYLVWFWSSNVRSTSIVLNSLVKGNVGDAPIRQMVRWMMAVRKNGRWGNTQENALAMEALVAYYRTFEAAPPDFRAIVKLGAEDVARQDFKGRSTTSAATDLPMTKVLAQGAAGSKQPLTFTREGTGTLFYTARLRYAADQLFQDTLDNGIRISRSYAPYVESGTRPASTTYKAGDLVRVTLTFNLTKERRFVAVADPLPAGFEAVESWFATTAASLARQQDDQGDQSGSWFSWWQRGGFDHVERFDDRIQLFATRLSEGRHEFSYIVRATTAGSFRTAPARAEEMYEPEVFGRTPTAVIEIRR
ncbi:MAG TPA: MG2 domain-containing protein [Vicinamibacterales bacterium]|nr:MG2 domain-containing protein [Vicinamibacterales bacterium]